MFLIKKSDLNWDINLQYNKGLLKNVTTYVIASMEVAAKSL
jgi:hypothetical protein